MESIYKLLGEPMSVFVCMLLGVTFFSLGAGLMGSNISKTIASGTPSATILPVAIGVALFGFISLSLGFLGLGEQIIEKELAAKGHL